MIEIYKKKHETVKEYEINKQEKALAQVQKSTDYEIAHNQSQDRIEELLNGIENIREYKNELRYACKILGYTYPKGYEPTGSQQEKDIIVKALNKVTGISYAREDANRHLQEIEEQRDMDIQTRQKRLPSTVVTEVNDTDMQCLPQVVEQQPSKYSQCQRCNRNDYVTYVYIAGNGSRATLVCFTCKGVLMEQQILIR